jgi:RimJ/RimL family protein N-acetyltransferase
MVDGQYMDISFKKLTEPTEEIATVFERWNNDPAIIPFIHVLQTKDDLDKWRPVTNEWLTKRLVDHEIYLIYNRDQLIGKVEYQANPAYLYNKETNTAWIAIIIGEQDARGKGIGALAMKHVEEQIKAQGFQRIELGVFEFNANAIKLYRKLGYQEIGRINDFTFWQGRRWQDIRMEKYLK